MIEDALVGLLRSVIVAFIAVGYGRFTAPLLRSSSKAGTRQIVLVLLCFVPLFAPTLLTGYAYSRWSLILVHHPWLKEIAYLTLLVFRVAPIGVLLFVLFPPALSDTGRHCLALARKTSGTRLKWRAIAAVLADTPGIVFCAALLFAYHEFEIASLSGVDAWTVRLFDAHAGGLPWAESISLAAVPLAIQLIIVAMLVHALRLRRSLESATATEGGRTLGARRVAVTWLLVGLGAGAVVLLPLVLISADAMVGLRQLLDSFALRKEIASSMLFGVSAGVLAFAISCLLPMRVLGALAVPALCGPLILALGAVRLFQMHGLSRLYDSPLPLIGVLTVLLLPIAYLLQTLRRSLLAGDSAHIATMSGAWLPRWKVSGRTNLAVVGLLFLLAFCELVASAILAPPGMTTASARLYNLMHYGQTAVLSAMVMAVFVLPLCISCVALGAAECMVRTRRMIGKPSA